MSSQPASGGGGSPAPTISLAAASQSIAAGQPATIAWTTTNAISIAFSPALPQAGNQLALPAGSATFPLNQTTTYVATVTDSMGRQASASISIKVLPVQFSFSAEPDTIHPGESTILKWTSEGLASLSIDNGVGNVSAQLPNGSVSVSPSVTTSYTATATDQSGAKLIQQATVNVVSPPPPVQPPPTISLTAKPLTGVAGQLSTVTWNTTNAVSITFSPALPQAEDRQLTLPSGSATFPLNQSTTYVATVTDSAGRQTSASISFKVLSAQFSFSAQPDTIHAGESATLKWTSQGIASLSIDGGVGSVNSLLPNGAVMVSPGVTTTYTATATDQGGNKLVQQAVVSVIAPQPPPASQPPLRHIIFMLQENRTFDNYFGALGSYRASKVPGSTARDVDGFDPNVALQTKTGKLVKPYHYGTVCTEGINFAWNESHTDMNLQAPDTFLDTDFSKAKFLMDRFAKTVNLTSKDPDGTRQMGHYDQSDLPYYYELATQFATSDRFYSSIPTNTTPNRMYMFTGTSFGNVGPATPSASGWPQKTIFRALNEAGVSWRYYYQDSDIYLSDFADYRRDDVKAKVYNIGNLFTVLSSPTADQDLPQVVFIERAGATGLDEHPENNIQSGAASVQKMIAALMNSSAWQSSVFILSYDEGGGLYDHVPPFQVPPPDNIAPILKSGDIKGTFNLSGFRIPITVISPWVKPHFVSHTPRELTSILKLIEATFKVPPLTKRDAWADDMSEFFDFSQPAWLKPPLLPTQPTDGVCNQSREAGPTF